MYALKSGWRLQGDIEWDSDIERTNQSSLNLRYHGDNNHLLNIGYRQRNDDSEDRLEQTDISAVFPVSDHWSVISRWNHDLIRDRIVEAFAGLEYQSCCWAVRVIGRHWINEDDITASDGVDEKDAIYIQFLLKGLGDIGSSTEQLFSDSIPGYQD
jgi:LPS-assembly protein